MPLTAFDTHGKGFVRAVLNDEPTGDVLVALQVLLEAGGASYTVVDVASELGVRLPLITAPAPAVRAPRPAPPSKSRVA